MAFSNLILTTGGKMVKAKVEQGSNFHILRVALGDGLLGNTSISNRNALVSEKMSLAIDTIQTSNDGTEAAIVVSLSNKNLAEGFYFREIGVLVEEPDTHQEVLYLYDNAGTDGEYISDGSGSVSINERLRLLVALDSTANITFEWSGNPNYVTVTELEESMKEVLGTVYAAGEMPPEDTRLFWVDTGERCTLKFYDGSGWVAVKTAWA